MPDAKVRGYAPTRFSFNSAKGGRCPRATGRASSCHEMSFLPDVRHALRDVRRRALRAVDARRALPRARHRRRALKLTAEEAAEVFRAHPRIARPLATLSDLGVGYVQLGQGSNTLSGGEAQRLKLAAELTAGDSPRAHGLRARRADDRPAPRRRDAAHRRARPPRRARRHARRHRASPAVIASAD